MDKNQMSPEILSQTLDALNPFPEFRPHQKEAIMEVLRRYRVGHETAVLNMPTGTGKSLIAEMIGGAARELWAAKTVITSPQIALVRQYGEEGIPMLLGKSNYLCQYDPPETRCSACTIKARWPKTQEDWRNFVDCRSICLYQQARGEFFAASLGVTTMAFALLDQQISADILIIDECYQLEASLISQAEIKFPKTISLSVGNDPAKVVGMWHKSITMNLGVLQRQMDNDGPHMSKTAQQRLAMDIHRLERDQKKCELVLRILSSGEEYVINAEENSLKLVDAKRLFDDIRHRFRFIVLMSATPGLSRLVPGYRDNQIEMPHPFPVEHRQTVYRPVGRMGAKYMDETIPKMAKRILLTHLEEAKGKKTIVHCGTYSAAGKLADEMRRDHRFSPGGVQIYLQDRENGGREIALRNWMERDLDGTDGAIFLSVNMTEGINLTGPDYPLNIIAKLPYPNLGDQWVARRKEIFPGWYEEVVMVAIEQAAGRCVRTPTDVAKCYILDATWGRMKGRLLPHAEAWWLESYVDPTVRKATAAAPMPRAVRMRKEE